MFQGIMTLKFNDADAVATLHGPLTQCGDEAFQESVIGWLTQIACLIEPRAMIAKDGSTFHVIVEHRYGYARAPGHTFVVKDTHWTNKQKAAFRQILLAMAELYDWDVTK